MEHSRGASEHEAICSWRTALSLEDITSSGCLAIVSSLNHFYLLVLYVVASVAYLEVEMSLSRHHPPITSRRLQLHLLLVDLADNH